MLNTLKINAFMYNQKEKCWMCQSSFCCCDVRVSVWKKYRGPGPCPGPGLLVDHWCKRERIEINSGSDEEFMMKLKQRASVSADVNGTRGHKEPKLERRTRTTAGFNPLHTNTGFSPKTKITIIHRENSQCVCFAVEQREPAADCNICLFIYYCYKWGFLLLL